MEWYSGLELEVVLMSWSLEWYSGFGAWSGTQVLELRVVLRVWSLEWYLGLELGLVLSLELELVLV